MAFFHITLNIRDAGRAIKMIVEHDAADLIRLIGEINDPEYPWLVGTEHRTLRNGDDIKWIRNPTALATASIGRINQTAGPRGYISATAPLILVEPDQEAA